jgi:polysaccharide export outer membrane protein
MMRNETIRQNGRSAVIAGVWILSLALLGTVNAQTSGPMNPQPKESAVPSDYTIGPGDLLSVSVSDAPEWSGKFRVTDAGMIEMSGLSSPVQADGHTPDEVGHAVRQALIDAKQLRDPRVNIFVEEFHGRTVTVLGAVSKPGVYPLERRTTALGALSLAGGALPTAGTTVTVVRGAASAEATGTAEGSVEIIDLSRVVKGGAGTGNVQVRNGDVVSVSNAPLVYVVGAVVKPGGFVLSDPASGISVVQALAMAQGLNSVAAAHHALVIRQSTSDVGRRDLPVDLAAVLAGKTQDVVLAPNDILYIPDSAAKKSLKVMADVAMAAVNGLAVYGLGYRVGTGNF